VVKVAGTDVLEEVGVGGLDGGGVGWGCWEH
jgi:hypothetical protein